mmetsp:Transcript_40923/g.65758  ORF Transcript_40923/g.65758 Transcript_40923/m.65758 type:complete len:118 (+) Transcript_40923:128-481(+)
MSGTEGAPTRQLSRHRTPDGRNSLRSHLFGNRTEGPFKTFFSRIMKKETYPLLAAVGGGMLLAGWFGQRHLFQSPDVTINKAARKATIRQHDEKAKAHVVHRESMRNMAGYVKKPEE